MALFEYTQVNTAGQEGHGTVDAASLTEARRKLRAAGIRVVGITERQADAHGQLGAKRYWAPRIRPRELSAATRQLAVVMLAGVPLVPALSALVEQLGDSTLGRVFAQVRDSVNGGAPLAKALGDYPSVFPNVFASMVQAGETTGTLESVLSRLADLYEKRAGLVNKVRAALAYPLFMAIVGSAVVVFVFSFVLPSITKLFLEMKMRLPWPTIMLIRASSFVSHYWWILAIILSGLVISQMYWLKRDSGRRFWDRFKLKCPLLGEVALKVAISRFSRTLGVLLASGVSIVEALELAERVTGNTVIERVVNDAKDAVSRGDSIASSLGRGGVFPPIVICMIAAGEQSGGIEEGLFRIADIFDSDVEAKLSTMTSLLEPVMIIVLGVVVGFIVLAVLLPIFDINKAIV